MGTIERLYSLFLSFKILSIIVYKTIVLFKLLKLMLYFSYIIIYILIPFLFLKFLMNKDHFLISLLILELLSLSFYFILSVNLFGLFFESVFIFYFLIILVCEGVLGLCLLVSVNYRYGSDYLFLNSNLIC